MKKLNIWRVATALFAAGSIIYTATSSSRSRQTGRQQKRATSEPEFDVPVEYQKVFDQNMIIPAGWAFALVWSTVYSGLGALLVHQALPAQAANPRYQKALPWWWASFALNAVFGRFFNDNHKRSILISDLTTKLNLSAALALHHSLAIGKTEVNGPEKYGRIPVSLYVGWLTAATVVGTPDTLLTLGWWQPNRQRDTLLSSAVLGATGLLGYGVARRLNDPWYMVPFVAGFGGIASRQWQREPLVALKAVSWAVIYAGLLAYWLPKGKFQDYEHPVKDTTGVDLIDDAARHLTDAEVMESDSPYRQMDPIEAEGLD